MKYLKQFMIILLVTFLGEMLHVLLPLPIPASIYGLVLMLAALGTKILRPEHVRECSDFLLKIMPLLFVPACVGLIPIWPVMKKSLLPIAVVVLVCTFLVFAVTGKTAQWIIGRKKK